MVDLAEGRALPSRGIYHIHARDNHESRSGSPGGEEEAGTHGLICAPPIQRARRPGLLCLQGWMLGSAEGVPQAGGRLLGGLRLLPARVYGVVGMGTDGHRPMNACAALDDDGMA